MIAQWEQDLASLQETAAPCRRSACDGQSVRLTRRTEGGLQVVVWSLRPDGQRLGLAALGRPGRDDDAQPAGQLAAQPAVPGQRDRASCARSTGLEQWQVYFFRGNAWTNCQSTGDLVQLPTAPAPPAVARWRAVTAHCPSGVRVVLGFAPGSGLAGNLIRDTLIAP